MTDLYRQELMDIYKDPSHKGKLSHPSAQAAQNNPLCGDALTAYLDIQKGKIRDIKFEANACAVSIISSELLADALTGKTPKEALKMSKDEFLKLLDLNLSTSRIKCATLALSVIQKALKEYEENNKTE